jgi:hypothetical protein
MGVVVTEKACSRWSVSSTNGKSNRLTSKVDTGRSLLLLFVLVLVLVLEVHCYTQTGSVRQSGRLVPATPFCRPYEKASKTSWNRSPRRNQTTGSSCPCAKALARRLRYLTIGTTTLSAAGITEHPVTAPPGWAEHGAQRRFLQIETPNGRRRLVSL